MEKVEQAPGTRRSIDVSESHGIGPQPIYGRDSHTADLRRFDLRLETLRQFKRRRHDAPFHQGFWDAVRAILAPCETSVGYSAEQDPTASIPKAPQDIQGLGARVGQLSVVNPIHPNRLAEACGVSLETALTELLVATRVGMVRMRWAPECVRCGSAVLITESLHELPGAANCWGCGKPNSLHTFDKIMTTFTFAPDVLYVLANNYACTPSSRSMALNAAFAKAQRGGS